MEFDQAKFEALAGKVVGDCAAGLAVLLTYVGDQCGLWAKIEETGPATAEDIAAAARLDARYVREWLSACAGAGYVTYEPEGELFSLSPEQAAVFAHEGEPTCMQGFYQLVVAQMAEHEAAVETFRTGAGRPWGDQHVCMFTATDRFFRPGYIANLVESWIPSLDGIEARLERGGKVADIGCGHGSSTLLMAERYPNATIVGFDYHAPSIESARAKAAESGISNVRFETVAAKEIAEGDFDLACIFDALHDMGDPVGAARHIRSILKEDGAFMVVEPMAGDSLSDNLHPLGTAFYGASTLVCVPCSRSQEVGLCLGAQAGEKRLSEVLREAGFGSVRRAAETPTNMVLEATG